MPTFSWQPYPVQWSSLGKGRGKEAWNNKEHCTTEDSILNIFEESVN